VLLSTTPLCVPEWQPLMAARKGLPVFQTHGLADAILPHALALEQRDMLQAAGLIVSWVSFPGGHELPQPVLEGLSHFIRKQLAIRQETNG
jgi:phospholipase/carboxylesterase